ncbi:MAG: hypothetical protein ACI4DY_11980 [Monoglobaceae bacterium]
MSLKSGFYNALLVDGDYDRKYNADDYSNNMGAIIKSGVLRDANNGFRVTASGLVLSVSPGRAWIEGRWAYLDTPYTFPAVSPPVGDWSRIDSVALRLNVNESVRAMSLVYTQGTPTAVPTAPEPVRTGGIYDIVLAHVTTTPGSNSLTVIDQRSNANICGWVTTPVGYDDYFKNLDAAFEDWFAEVRTTLATTTLFKQYTWRTVLTAEASYVIFDIPQYDPTGVDIIQVYVNGMLETAGVDYTLSNKTITFITSGGGTGTKVAGTEIVVICYKSIDGAGLGSVADRITALENQVNTIDDASEYTYICNGTDDNIKLSEIAQTWLNGGTDYGSKTIKVCGTFGATAAYAGEGTSASPYRWFSLGAGTTKNRRIIFDFSCCSQISINCADDTHNIIIYGFDVNVIGLNIVATGGAAIYMFSTAANIIVNAERCRFWITSKSGLIARTGTFRDCRISLTTTEKEAYAFHVHSAGLLRLYGGEYYAYSPTISAIVFVLASQTDAVVNTYSINCPMISRSGYIQAYAISCDTNNGKCSFTDTITPLAISADGQNIRGTIALNKPGMY